MPNITVEGPGIEDLDTKRELVKTVTDAAVKAFGLPEKAIVVVIRENPPENVGVGGKLIVDPVMSHKNVCKWYDACPLKFFYERGKLDEKWVRNYCWGDNSKCVRKKMEESGEYHPDNMLPDGSIDEKL